MARRRTAVVGDSLGVGTVPHLRQRLGGGVDADVRVGRSSRDGIRALKGMLARGNYDRIVADLGTNDGNAAQLHHSLKVAHRLAAGRPIYVPTVRGPGAAEKNALIRRLGAKGAIHVVDWAARSGGLVGGDGIHATPQGYAARAGLLARTIGSAPVAHAAARGGGLPRGGGGLPTKRSREITRLILMAAHQHGIPASTLAGLIEQESGFDPSAKSTAGAQGITQFIPTTAKSHGVQYGTSHHAVATQIFGAAQLLRENGYRKDPHNALGRYYGDPSAPYAGEVLAKSKKYRYLDGAKAPAGGGGGGTPGTPGTPATVQRSQVQPGGTGLAGALLAAAQAQRPQPQSALPAPSFSASAPLPKGYQDLSSGPPQPPPASPQDLLAAVGQEQGIAQSRVVGGTPATSGSAPSSGGGGALPGGGGPGKLIGRPSDRAGVPTSPKVLALVKKASGIGGFPITLGTGTNHNQFVDGRPGVESDHWRGHALDLPASGKQGDRIAGALLVAVGVPRARARYLAQHGTGYTRYNGHQILWRVKGHFDHVHVSA